MHLFNCKNLATAFPIQPLVAELISVLHTYHQATVNRFTPVRCETLKDLFKNYVNFTGKEISEELQGLVSLEEADLEANHISQVVNKVIFNTFEAKDVDEDQITLEFHHHTYDIHVLFSGSEGYLFRTLPHNESLFEPYDKENDGQLIKGADEYLLIPLAPDEGLVIPPHEEHWAGVNIDDDDKTISKIVVKIDARYANYLNLV